MAEPSVWRFTSADLLATSPLTPSASADGATCIVVQGSRVTLGDGDGGGAVTTTTEVEVSAPYAIKGATFSQAPITGQMNLLSNPGDKPAELQVVRRIITSTTKADGCVLRTQVDTHEPFRRERARYNQLSTGGRSPAGGAVVYVDADGTEDGDQKAWADRYERLQLVQRVITTPFYTDDLGELELTEIRTGRWFNPAAALFVQNNPFQEPNRRDVFTRGTGQGVQLGAEAFFGGAVVPKVDVLQVGVVPPGTSTIGVWYQIDRTVRTHEEGFELVTEEESTRFGRTDTGIFLYDEIGSTRSLFAEVRAVVAEQENTTRTAIAGEEGSHSRITTEIELGETTKITTESLGQYLPAVQACSRELADRQSSAPITAIVCAGEATRHPVVLIVNAPWVETVDEATAFGTQELRELHAIEAAATIPPNAVLHAGDVATLHVPRRGFVEQPCWIDTIQHQQEARAEGEAAGPITGSVVLKIPTL